MNKQHRNKTHVVVVVVANEQMKEKRALTIVVNNE
jgi:hypothetical protein